MTEPGLRPVELSTVAQSQYDSFCRRYPRARQALNGAILSISYGAATFPLPATIGLRQVTTRAGAGTPAFVVTFAEADAKVQDISEI